MEQTTDLNSSSTIETETMGMPGGEAGAAVDAAADDEEVGEAVEASGVDVVVEIVARVGACAGS